jgi:hypothetical protein
MEHLISKNKIIEEISLIPDDKIIELYDLIHNFRMGLNQSENNLNEIMQFAVGKICLKKILPIFLKK